MRGLHSLPRWTVIYVTRYAFRIHFIMNTHAPLPVHGTVVYAIAFAVPFCFRVCEVVDLLRLQYEVLDDTLSTYQYNVLH